MSKKTYDAFDHFCISLLWVVIISVIMCLGGCLGGCVERDATKKWAAAQGLGEYYTGEKGFTRFRWVTDTDKEDVTVVGANEMDGLKFESHQFSDEDGNPAGGHTFGVGVSIAWQNGPLGRGTARKEPNGAFTETVINMVIDRINFYQKSKFACDSNAKAIKHLELALATLNSRTADREERDVEGTHSE